MDTIFEYILYTGLLIAVIAMIWFLAVLIRGPRRTFWKPLLLLLLGATIAATPAIISQNMAVDLGPRDKMVRNTTTGTEERHVTLTGWDGETYSVLKSRQDAVVLQMANKDVTDQSLEYLAGMTKLRRLDLNDAQITDAGLKIIAGLSSLEELRIRGAKITDAGFREHMMPMDGLLRLNVQSTGLSADVVDEWKTKVKGRRVQK